MRDRIEIDKNLLPYSFDILLASERYNLEFKYNESFDLFTVTLSKNDKVLVYDEPLIFGMPLFGDLYTSGDFPILTIEPYDESGQETDITYDNFGETVFLTINNFEDNENEQ